MNMTHCFAVCVPIYNLADAVESSRSVNHYNWFRGDKYSRIVSITILDGWAYLVVETTDNLPYKEN